MAIGLLGAAALTGGASLFGGLFGGSRANKDRKFQAEQSRLNRIFTGRQNFLSREQQSEQFGQQFGLNQQRFGFQQRQFNEQQAGRQDINESLLGQIGLLQGGLGQSTMSQADQEQFVQSQLGALRPQQQKYGSIIARTLGLETPQGQRAIAGNLLNTEANVRSGLANRVMQQDFQRDTQFQGLIASLLGQQRG